MKSLVPVGGSSVIAAMEPRGSLDFYYQPIGTKPWHAELVAGTGTTISAPSVAQRGYQPVADAETTVG
jgi:hypothetical protein